MNTITLLKLLEEFANGKGQLKSGEFLVAREEETYECRWQTGKECKELRERHKMSLEDMQIHYGYPQDVYQQWEERNFAIYPDAMRDVYKRMTFDASTSNYELALGEILYRYPFLKIDKVVQQILEKYEVCEILGEDVEEWVK